MSTFRIIMTMIVGCCVAGMTLGEPAAKAAPRRQRQRPPAVEMKTEAEKGSFMGRVVQMDDKQIVVRNREGKMTFRPLRPKVKAPEGLAVGSIVKVEWSAVGKAKRIDAIEKQEWKRRPGVAVEGGKKAETVKEKPAVKKDAAKKGQDKGAMKGAGKGEKKQKRDGTCKGCPTADKAAK